jgi:hypothetical protein
MARRMHYTGRDPLLQFLQFETQMFHFFTPFLFQMDKDP